MTPDTLSSRMPSPVYEDRFPAEPRYVASARQQVTEFARRAGMSSARLDDVALVVSEAVTNGVLHAFPADGPGIVRVRAECADDTLTVTIEDDGVGMRPRPDSPGLGLGLGLMRRLCSQFEVDRGPDGVGTTVRMSFGLAAAPRGLSAR